MKAEQLIALLKSGWCATDEWVRGELGRKEYKRFVLMHGKRHWPRRKRRGMKGK